MMEKIHAIIEVNATLIRQGILPVWTLYDHPTDFPDNYVARLHVVGKTGLVSVGKETVVSDDLEELRDLMLDCGLTVVPRMGEDDPVIVETWV